MGLFSGLFGKSKEEKALQEAFQYIQKLLEDEEYQLELKSESGSGFYHLNSGDIIGRI